MDYLLLWSGHVKGMRKVRVPSKPAMYAGHLDETGSTVRPCDKAVRDALPYRFRHAFDKSNGAFWFNKHRADAPATLLLRGHRGRELVNLVLQPLTKEAGL